MNRNLATMFFSSKFRSGRSLLFDGISDWMANLIIFGAETFRIRRGDPVSVSMWVRNEKDAAVTQQTIISRWFPTDTLQANEGGWEWYIQDLPGAPRALSFRLSTFLLQNLWLRSDAPFPLNTWVHVCMTYDGSGNIAGLKMYWDGVLQAVTTIFSTWTDPTVPSNQFSHLMWGCLITAFPSGGPPSVWPPVPALFFEGKIDESCFWRFTLSAAEVLALYNGGHPADPLHVGLSNGRTVNRYFRMGEGSDGAPLGALSTCVNRMPVGGVGTFSVWNNDGQTPPLRVTGDTA
jgi:hypothetical protein